MRWESTILLTDILESGSPESFGVPLIETNSLDTSKGLSVTQKTLSAIASSEETLNALTNTDYSKSYVIEKDGKAYSVQPTKDGSKNVIVEIDKKTNEIRSVTVKDSDEEVKFAKILPKSDANKLKFTKIKGDDGKPTPYAMDGSGRLMQASADSKGSVAIYSSNPLKESEIVGELTAKKVMDSFDDLPKSLSKTIEAKIKDGKIIDYLATRASGELNSESVLKTVEKLGYDGYFKNNGEAIVDKSAVLSYPVKGNESDGRKGIRDKEEGKRGISTKELRGEFIQRVKGEASYSERPLGDVSKALQGKSKDGKIKIVSEKAYTPDMTAISKKIKEGWGIKAPVSFVVSDGALLDDEEGFHTKDGIYVVLDNVEGDAANVAMHEAWHALEEEGEHPELCTEVINNLASWTQELDMVVDDKGMDGIRYDDGYGPYFALLYQEFAILQKELGDDWDAIFSELAGDFVSGRIAEGGKSFSAAPKDIQDYIGRWWKKLEGEVSGGKPSYYSDTQGNRLSEEQKAFFSKSKVRDKFDKNKLRVVYNATDVDFNTFSYSNIGRGAGMVYGPGFYFSFDDIGDTYGVSGGREFYLNMVNPGRDNAITFTEKEIQAVIDKMDELYDGKISKELAASYSVGEIFEQADSDVQVVTAITTALKGIKKDNPGVFGDLTKVIYDVTRKDGIIIYHPKDGSVKQVVCWNANAIKSIYNLSPSEDEDNVRFAKKSRLTNWVTEEPTEKAKAFIEANKDKEPKKVGSFIANEGFETTEAEITIRKNKESGKWEITTYDKYTKQTIQGHSFKRWGTALRYITDVYGDDIRRLPTSKEEATRASKPAKASTATQEPAPAKRTTKAVEKALAKSKTKQNEKTPAKAEGKPFDKSENNADYIANKDFATQEKTVSIIYNEDSGKYDVLTHDNYIDRDLPTKSFKRFHSAKEYAKTVFGELTKVENKITLKDSDLYKSLSKEKQKMLDELDKDKFSGNIIDYKRFDLLDESHIEFLYNKMLAEKGECAFYTEDKIKSLSSYSKVEEYVDSHIPLNPSEHADLIEKTAKESYDLITKGKKPVKTGDKATLFIAMGNAGAGKSSTGINKLIEQGYVEDDNDIFKSASTIKDYFDGGLGANVVQEIVKASQMSVSKKLFEENYNIALPIVGGAEKSILKWIKMGKEHGYNIKLAYVSSEKDKCINRAYARFLQTGRYVPVNYISQQALRVEETAKAIYNKKGELIDETDGKRYRIDELRGFDVFGNKKSQGTISNAVSINSQGIQGKGKSGDSKELPSRQIQQTNQGNNLGTDALAGLVDNQKTTSLVTNKEKNSAAKLIEAGADVSKNLKVRLKDVRDAFVTAVKETLPENSKFKLSADAIRETMAEVDLVKDPKKVPTIAENMLKRLRGINVTVTGDNGEEKMKLGDFMSPEQEKGAFGILTNALNGKAQPTELAKWAKSLEIEKERGKQNIRTFRLLATAKKRIANASKDYLSAPGLPPIEVSVYSKVLEGVKAPFTTASLKKLADNVSTLYTEESLGQMLTAYGLGLDGTTQSLAKSLAGSFEDGKKLSYYQIEMGNAIVDLLNHEMSELAKGVRNANFKEARDAVTLAQAAYMGSKTSKLDSFKNGLSHIDHSIRSPISILDDEIGEFNPFVIHIEDGGKACENAQRAKISEFNEMVFGKGILSECGFTSVDNLNAELNKKLMLHGYKITMAKALKVIDTYKTAEDPLTFFIRGISFEVNGKRTDILDMTQDDIDDLNSKIPNELLDWNEKAILATYNGAMRDYTQGCFKRNTGVEFLMVKGIYYPRGAVGDKAPDLNVSGKGFINPNDFGLSFLKERVSHTNAPFNMDGDVVSDMNNRIVKLTQWGEWSQWYKKLRVLEDTPVYGKGTTLNAILEKNMPDWPTIRDFIHRTALGVGYDNSVSLLGKIDSAVGGALANLSQVAMMDIFTQNKTLGSDFTGWQYFGVGNVLKGLTSYFANGGVAGESEARRVIEKYSPTLKERFNSMEAFNTNIGKVAKGRMNKALTTPVRYLDMHIHLKGYYMAVEQAKNELGANATQEQIEERAVRILEKFSDTTQPTTSKFRVGMYRSGANGKIIKQVFGMFQSMGQNIYQGLHDVTVGWARKIQLMDNYQKSIDEHTRKLDEYAQKQAKAEEMAKNAKTDEEREKYEKEANEAEFHKEGHESNAEKLKDILKKMKAKYTGKYYASKLSAYVAGLIGSGLALTLISKLKKKVYGTEEWDDWDAKELAEETAYQSFVNWIPFIGTIANSIRNDSDLSVFTIDNLNSFVDAAKGVVESVQDGDMTKITGKTLKLLTLSASLFGIPAQSMWKIINGAWYNIDKESNISFRESMGLLTATSIKSNYSDALEKGQKDKAIANLDVWMNVYSSKGDKSVAEEIYRLGRLGYTGVSPSTYPTTYTDDSGATVSYSSSQLSDYRAIYSKAGTDASSMIASSTYKSLDDEYKAKAMKYLYSAYSQASKAKAAGTTPSGKAAKILLLTNGDVEMARYIAAMESLSGLTKEKAISKANGFSGFSKAEKLLTLWLAGYSLTDANITQLVNWIASNGGSRTEAVSLIS